MSANWRQTLYKDFDPEGFVTDILWRGINVEGGNYLWYTNDSTVGLNSWLVTQQIGPILKVADDDTINDGNSTEAEEGSWYKYNGHRYWKLVGGDYLWYSTAEGGWVISSKLGACTEEVWFTDHYQMSPIQSSSDSADEGSQTGSTDLSIGSDEEGNAAEIDHDNVSVTGISRSGDICTVSWSTTSAYDGSSFIVELYDHYYRGHDWWGPSTSLEDTYEARGSNRGNTSGEYEGTPKTVGLTYTGYKRIDNTGVEPAGEYEEFTRNVDGSINVPSDPATGEVGLPQWTDADGTTYIRSLKKNSNSQYSYGKIYYDGEKWLIGIKGSRGGWWEGDEPDRNSNVTFTAMKVANKADTEDDDTVNVGDHIEDDDTADIIVSFDQLVAGNKFVNTFTDKIVLAAQVGMWL